MVHRIFFAALAAGLLAGALITAVQSVTTTPIILHAEEFEAAAHDHSAESLPAAGVHLAASESPSGYVHLADTGGGHAGEAWVPEDGLERTLYTALANLIVGVGFALLVVAGMALRGTPVTIGVGVLWGAAGFVVFILAPALGLAPEVPGSITAGLEARQYWWVFAASGAALGLGLIVFCEARYWKALGVIAAAIPHIVGAPQPDSIGGSVPPELAGQFAATSIVVGAIFWVLIGSLSAAFYRRLS